MEALLQAQGDAFLTGLVLRVATADPAELEVLLTTLKEQERLDIVTKDLIFLRWMEIDPAGGLVAARAHRQVNSAFWAWAKVNPEDALAGARGDANPRALGEVVRAIGQSDPKRGMALIDELREGFRRGAWDGILSAVAFEDPKRAAEISLELNLVDPQRIQIWIRNDPQSAFPWLAARLDPESSEFARMVDGLMEAYPERVSALVSGLPDGLAKTTATIAYAGHLSVRDPDAALTLLRSQPASIQDHAFGVIAQRLARFDVDAALTFLEQVDWETPPPNVNAVEISFPNGESSEMGGSASSAPIDAIDELMVSDASRAARFLESLPPSEFSKNVYSRAMARWMDRDSIS